MGKTLTAKSKHRKSVRRSPYMYGKVHHIKHPYLQRIHSLFEEYRRRIHEFSSDHRINNLLVDLRNDTGHLVGEIYQQLAVELRHSVSIAPSRRRILASSPSGDETLACGICEERRVLNRCHIIPGELGGKASPDNILILCPNHHFLFDQSRLSEEELSRLNLSGKADDAREYYEKIHVKRHAMYWKYGAHKFSGCNCGGVSFDYGVHPNGNFIQPCLVCQGCGESWGLGPSHPLTLEISVEAFDIFAKLETSERADRIRKATLKAQALLDSWLKRNPHVGG